MPVRTKLAIYEKVVEREMKSPDKGLYLLSYLKIRFKANSQAGYFTLEHFIEATQLHQKTAKKHITNLIRKGYVLKAGTNRYNCVSMKTAVKAKAGDLCIDIHRDFIMSMSWKNISAFRAFLIECFYEKLEYNKKKYRSKKVVKRMSLKDKCAIPQDNERFLEAKYHQRVATTFGKKIFNFSASTFCRYRDLVDDVNYIPNRFVVYDIRNVTPYLEMKIRNFVGYEHDLGENRVLFSGVSKRMSTLHLFKHKPLRGRATKKVAMTKTFPFEETVPF